MSEKAQISSRLKLEPNSGPVSVVAQTTTIAGVTPILASTLPVYSSGSIVKSIPHQQVVIQSTLQTVLSTQNSRQTYVANVSFVFKMS